MGIALGARSDAAREREVYLHVLTHDIMLLAGYSNDVFAYLPSKRVPKEGGYQGGRAMKYMSYPHPDPFADTVEERVVGKARQLVERVEQPAGK